MKINPGNARGLLVPQGDRPFSFVVYSSEIRDFGIELKNRRLHILYKDGSLQKENTASIAKEMFLEAYQHSTTHNHETKKLIDAIHNNPKITQAELAVLQGYSLSKIKRQIAELQSKGLLERIGGRKLGSWKILDGLELLD